MTRSARHSATGSDFPLSVCSPEATYEIAASLARRVRSPTKTVPGSATDCTRAAVLTRSPATMPCPVAPTVTAASPVTMPTRIAISAPTSPPSAATTSTSSSPARTARSGSSSRATGVPQTAITASPMNFSTVPP